MNTNGQTGLSTWEESASSHLTSNGCDRTILQYVHPPEWRNPEPKDRYNLVIIGAGPAGILTALNAAKVGAKVALVERDRLGGACFNLGCISSKAIIRTSRLSVRTWLDATQNLSLRREYFRRVRPET